MAAINTTAGGLLTLTAIYGWRWLPRRQLLWAGWVGLCGGLAAVLVDTLALLAEHD